MPMNVNRWRYLLVLSVLFASCNEQPLALTPVSYSDFERFVDDTKYITDAERSVWSIVQVDVYNF